MKSAILLKLSTALSFVLLAMCGLANAQSLASSNPDQWQYAVTVYGYLPSIYGASTFPNGAAGPTFKLSAHTIVSNLNLAFMGRVRARKGQWGMLADWIYSDVSDGATATRDFSVPGVPIPVGVTGNFKLRAQSSLLTLAGTRQFLSEPQREMDLVFGVRMDDLQQKFDWQLSAALPGFPERAGRSNVSKTNWDAIVGVLGREYFANDPRWFIPYYVDIGAGSSKFTGQIAAGVGYRYDWGEVTAGWRCIDYRFKSGSLISRTSFSGPAAGLTWRF